MSIWIMGKSHVCFGSHSLCILRQYLEKKNTRARIGSTLLIPPLNPRRHRQISLNSRPAWSTAGSQDSQGYIETLPTLPTKKDRISYLDLQLTYLASVTGQWAPGFPNQLWDHKRMPLHLVFYLSAEDHTQILMLTLQALNPLSHLPTPPISS